MIPENPSELERKRFVMLTVMRAGGVVLMVLGLWLWLGEVVAWGEKVGPLLFISGVVESLLLPAVLARNWQSPRQP